MITEISAGVENYECGKLSREELAKVLESAPAEALREYILNVIAYEPLSGVGPTDIGAIVQSFKTGEITPDEFYEELETATIIELEDYARKKRISNPPKTSILNAIYDRVFEEYFGEDKKIPA